MKTMLLSRLNRAITCINAYDSDKVFNEKLKEARQYAQFMNEKDCNLEEIIHVINDALSRIKHSKKEKEQIIKKLRFIQKKIKQEL